MERESNDWPACRRRLAEGGTALVVLLGAAACAPLTPAPEGAAGTRPASEGAALDGGEGATAASRTESAGERRLRGAEPQVGDAGSQGYGATTNAEEDARKSPWSGFVNLRSRTRWADDLDRRDQDLFGVLGLDFDSGGSRPWGGKLLMRGAWGVDSQEPDSVFFGLEDTYSNQLDGQIYRAYVDAPIGHGLRLARLGRMAIYDTPVTAFFDGALLESEPVGPTKLVAGAYGGRSVHLSEGAPSDEWMAGLYTRFEPWDRGRLRLDWMHLSNDDRFGTGDNDLVSAGISHTLGDDLRLETDYSLLDGHSNDLGLKGFWVWPEEDMTVRVSYYRLIEAQRNLAFELNPYFNVLNSYFPYDQTQVAVSKGFGTDLELFGGVDIRRVDDESDIGRFNRDFDRYYLTASLPELLPLETALTLTAEVWDSPGNDMQTWGLDLTKELFESTKLSVGSYYSLYKYFFDVDSERDNVRTFYGELRCSLSEEASLVARYELEDENIDTFHTLWVGVTWRF